MDSGMHDEAERLLLKARAEKKRKRMRRRIAFAAIAVMAVILGLLVAINRPDSAEAEVEGMMLEATVMENVYTQAIDLSGYVEPYDTQETKFRSTGAVTGVYVKEGDKVKEGQLLASIDNTAQLADLQSIRDSIEEAELRGSARELELLKLQEINAENALEYTNIVANFDGEVASVDVEVNDYFEAGDSVMTIVDRSRLKATVEIDEIDMPYVYEGQKAFLVFEAYPQMTVEAVVDYIPMLGRYTDQGIGVVDAELLIENPPEGIIPGFTFEGTLEAESETTMLLIPYSAVERGWGGSRSVTVLADDGSTRRVDVRIEYLGEGLAEVLEGDIKPGDKIVMRSRN